MAELTQEQERVRQILIYHASNGKYVIYTELVKEAKLDLDMTNPYHRNLLGHILGGISVYEHANDRPMLSSVVVSKESLMPSDGFYKLAEELGFGSWRKLKENFWGIEEMKRAFAFWSKSST